MRLRIELVPSTVWRSSVYRLVSRNQWAIIKQDTYTKEGRICYICNSKQGPFSAHEFWEYDDKGYTQKLVDIHHLCNLCHKIKHIGFWCWTEEGKAELKKQGLGRKDLIKHFCDVNRCTEEAFLEHEKEAFEIWRKRSMHEWKQDFGDFNKYINESKR